MANVTAGPMTAPRQPRVERTGAPENRPIVRSRVTVTGGAAGGGGGGVTRLFGQLWPRGEGFTTQVQRTEADGGTP